MCNFKKRFFCVSLLISSLLGNSCAMEDPVEKILRDLDYGIEYSLGKIDNCKAICKECGYKYYDCIDHCGPYQGLYEDENCFRSRQEIWRSNEKAKKTRIDRIAKEFLLCNGEKEYKDVTFRLYSDRIISLEKEIKEGKSKAEKLLMGDQTPEYKTVEQNELELIRSKRPWFHKFRECYIDDSTNYIPVSVFLDWCIGLFGEVASYENKKGKHIINFDVKNLFMEAISKSENKNKKKSKKTFDRCLWKPFIDFNDVISSSSTEKETQYHVLAKILYDYVFPFVRNDKNLPTGKKDITRKLLCLIINKSEQYCAVEEIIAKLESVKNSVYGSIENDFLKLPEDKKLSLPSYEGK